MHCILCIMWSYISFKNQFNQKPTTVLGSYFIKVCCANVNSNQTTTYYSAVDCPCNQNDKKMFLYKIRISSVHHVIRWQYTLSRPSKDLISTSIVTWQYTLRSILSNCRDIEVKKAQYEVLFKIHIREGLVNLIDLSWSLEDIFWLVYS